jgi:hypothetical protein
MMRWGRVLIWFGCVSSEKMRGGKKKECKSSNPVYNCLTKGETRVLLDVVKRPIRWCDMYYAMCRVLQGVAVCDEVIEINDQRRRFDGQRRVSF